MLLIRITRYSGGCATGWTGLTSQLQRPNDPRMSVFWQIWQEGQFSQVLMEGARCPVKEDRPVAAVVSGWTGHDLGEDKRVDCSIHRRTHARGRFKPMMRSAQNLGGEDGWKMTAPWCFGGRGQRQALASWWLGSPCCTALTRDLRYPWLMRASRSSLAQRAPGLWNWAWLHAGISDEATQAPATSSQAGHLPLASTSETLQPQIWATTVDHFSGSPRYCLRLEDVNIFFAHLLPTSLAHGVNALSQGRKLSQTAEQGCESIWGHTREPWEPWSHVM